MGSPRLWGMQSTVALTELELQISQQGHREQKGGLASDVPDVPELKGNVMAWLPNWESAFKHKLGGWVWGYSLGS